MLNLIKKRRSIRIFQERKIESDKIDRIIQAALLSPSSKNNRPWKFIVVDSKELLLNISEAKSQGSQFVANAPLALIVLADPDQSDVWIEDCSIATTIIILAAQDLGLGSCWVQIRRRNHSSGLNSEIFIKKIFSIPNNLRVLSIVAIGYPKKEKSEKLIEEKKLEDVYLNKFGRMR